MLTTERLREIYGNEAEEAGRRFAGLLKNFKEKFGKEPENYFTAPGRTEIIGNHTDHNGGRILAASITLDTICAAGKTDDNCITIISEGYKKPIIIDLARLDEVPTCQGSVSLVAGILAAAKKYGFKTGGFRAYASTKVIRAAGVSSSASFEMMVCAVLNHFYNEGKISYADYARMGQYAENVYWEKASGLMDQMACAVGGTILLDFHDGVSYEKTDFSFDMLGCDLLIVNTGKGHSDLSEEYSSIPGEMRAVARAMGAENLCEVKEEEFLEKLPAVRKKVANDRALMRALHYFEECRRVDAAVSALRDGKPEKMLDYIRDGGNSSWKWLQNGYVISTPEEQSIPLVLALSETFFERKGRGACRIHGGGFAGVVMCVVPKEDTEEFVRYLSPFVGEENIYNMGIRQAGAVCVG
ncbi:MAG: galactokinase [Clostridium sp.]|nr:galactokinase [Clostridium sp.]